MMVGTALVVQSSGQLRRETKGSEGLPGRPNYPSCHDGKGSPFRINNILDFGRE